MKEVKYTQISKFESRKGRGLAKVGDFKFGVRIGLSAKKAKVGQRGVAYVT